MNSKLHILPRLLRSSRTLVFLVAPLLFGAVLFALQQPQLKGEPEARAALGEKLFLDPILSLDSSISCASCHQPDHAFADTRRL